MRASSAYNDKKGILMRALSAYNDKKGILNLAFSNSGIFRRSERGLSQ